MEETETQLTLRVGILVKEAKECEPGPWWLLTGYVPLGLSHPVSGPQLPSLKHGVKAILSFLTKVRVLEQNQEIVISSSSGPEPV